MRGGGFFALAGAVICLVHAAPAPATEPATPAAATGAALADLKGLKVDYTQYNAAFERFAVAKNMAGMKALAEAIERNYAPGDITEYATLMQAVVGHLNSYQYGEIGDVTHYMLAQRLAKTAAAKPGLPLEIRAALVMTMQSDPEASGNEEEWVSSRKEKARLWLSTWVRLAKIISPEFDVDKVPMLNIAPPPEAGAPAGVHPDAIKDPELRARYAAAVQANAIYTAWYNEQYQTRLILKRFTPAAETYLVQAYAQRPANPAELRALIGKHDIPADAAERMLKKLSPTATKPSR